MVTQLLQSIPQTVGPKKGGAFSQWHELLGWYTPDSSQSSASVSTETNLTLVKKQIHLLWNHRTVKLLMGDSLKEMVAGIEKSEAQMPQLVSPGEGSTSSGSSGLQSNLNNILKRALDRGSSRQPYYYPQHKTWHKLGSPEVTKIALVSAMYHAAITTLSQLRLDILSGICYSDHILHDLWLLVTATGPQCGLKGFLELLQVNSTPSYSPQILLLLLFCDCMTHYVTYV